jgi:predicted RecB family nuclease
MTMRKDIPSWAKPHRITFNRDEREQTPEEREQAHFQSLTAGEKAVITAARAALNETPEERAAKEEFRRDIARSTARTAEQRDPHPVYNFPVVKANGDPVIADGEPVYARITGAQMNNLMSAQAAYDMRNPPQQPVFSG